MKVKSFYQYQKVEELIRFIEKRNGIADKKALAEAIKTEFALVQDRKVFYCEDFAIRFSKSEKKKMSNTVLSLSALQKYDTIPFIVCIVSSAENYMLLANTTFLKKISHSSQALRVDNIKGSFNGSDIMDTINGIKNEPKNFAALMAIHKGFTFQDNLERLVEATNGIVGRVQKYVVGEKEFRAILESANRTEYFLRSAEYRDLKSDLYLRVTAVQNEIVIASLIDNVNIRGRIIEYLITEDASSLKEQIIKALNDKTPLPKFKTADKLGDYSKEYTDFLTETDIKTKVLFLDGNPKAYNIDKLLEFLSEPKSVYMIYLIGIDENGKITTKLCSAFDKRLIADTNVIHHWAGRNSRGVAQFVGHTLNKILLTNESCLFDVNLAKEYLKRLISL